MVVLWEIGGLSVKYLYGVILSNPNQLAITKPLIFGTIVGGGGNWIAEALCVTSSSGQFQTRATPGKIEGGLRWFRIPYPP